MTGTGRNVGSSHRGTVSLLVGLATVVAAAAKPNPVEPGDLIIRRSRITGNASFVTARNGGAMVLPSRGEPARDAIAFLRERGALFGVGDPMTQLVQEHSNVDSLGHRHTTLRQVHAGVRVFGGVLKVHQDAAGDVVAANGDFYPVPAKLNTRPGLSGEAAAALAARAVGAGQPAIEFSELVIVDPGWYGDPPIGPRLAYHVIVFDMTVPVRESFLIDAHAGSVLDRWDMIHSARVREVYNGDGGPGLPGTLARGEGDPAVVSPADVNRAYDYAGDVYDYYFRAFGRDSIDDNGMTLVLTVNSTAPPCPNAFWNGTQMVFCTGTVTDDVTAHEIAHGVTERTANLIYQNQPGQLNEAYSDIFGELIDLFNGNAAFSGPPGGTPWPPHATGPGLDTPNNLRTGICSESPGHADGVRWLLGEDATAFGGAIRDMWNPPCEGDPDRANSPLQTCNPLDSGGVHSGSGIANHAFAILTDGKSFNGQTVTGIGPIKSGAVWYRALTVYLTPASDFQDAYAALNQAALDLIGTTPNDPRTGLPSGSAFTAADAAEVDQSLLAVEMNTEGACGASDDILSSVPPVLCPTQTVLYSDDFEGGVNGWTVANDGPLTPYDWVQTSDLAGNRPGTAWFAADPDLGNCSTLDESGTHTLFSPMIKLPAVLSRPTIAFTHFLATERGWDGGNVSVRVGGGAWQLVPPSAFSYNAYNGALVPIGAGNTNPLGGQPGWTGAGGGWGTSLIDLTGFVSGGETLEVRFDFGKDGCTGSVGWFVDDFEVYTCPCTLDSDCDDGRFCTGAENCSASTCQSAGTPCGLDACDEEGDLCLVGVRFRERFETGNVQGWSLYAADSTATRGAWVIGNPNGTTSDGPPAQPENAFEGANCAFTAHNGSAGVDDVDNGVAYLVSPTINLSGATAAELSYVRWFFNRDLGEDAEDTYTVDVSDDDGFSWMNLETLGTLVNANSWTPRTYALESFISLTANVRLRFGTSDGLSTGNLIEGALDDVTLSITAQCLDQSGCADGVFCNGVEQCVSNQCQAGADPCPGEVCDEGAEACLPLPCEDAVVTATGGRRFRVTPASRSTPVALRVTGDPGHPDVACVAQYVQADGTLGPAAHNALPADWGTVAVRGPMVVPAAGYRVTTECGSGISAAAPVTTHLWGDLNHNGFVDVSDILLALDGFSDVFGVPFEAIDILPCQPDGTIDVADILGTLDAFAGDPFSASCDPPCE